MAQLRARVEWHQYRMLTKGIVEDILRSGWRPNVVVGLQSSGYFVAATLAKLLEVSCIPCLDVVKDAHGVRSLGGAVALNPDRIRGKRVLGVDDTVITGTLARLLRQEVTAAGGDFRMAALIGVVRDDDFPTELLQYVGACTSQTPTMPWAWLMKP